MSTKSLPTVVAAVLLLLLSATPLAAFGENIPNGGEVAGTIAVDGETDTHTFSGTAGQQGVISVSGDISSGEFIRVFNPDASELASTSSRLFLDLAQSGTYTMVVSSFQATGTGNYRVHLALAPGANEHGLIPNGGSVAQSIDDDGEIDSFTFQGDAGQEGLISISGNVTGSESYRVFNPDGTQLLADSNQAFMILPQTGTYTVVASSFQAAGTGDYEVHLALAPGANEHGPIPNGGSVGQSIDDNGEIDSFTFFGNAGQEGVVSISGDVLGGEFYRVFNPDGTQLLADSNQAFLVLPQTGTYTVVASSFQASGTGDYAVHLALAPGANEHGLIPNGGSAAQNIDDNGEIDSFTFTGLAGQEGSIVIAGDVVGGEFMRVFNPDGTQLGASSSDLALDLTQDGIHTVVARSFQASGTGAYTIALALKDLPAPLVVLAPNSLSFGDLPVGASLTGTVMVENAGDGALLPESITISGIHADDFAIQSNTCLDAELTTGESCFVEVSFSPASVDLRQAVLEINSNAASSPDLVPLRGNNDRLFGDRFER